MKRQIYLSVLAIGLMSSDVVFKQPDYCRLNNIKGNISSCTSLVIRNSADAGNKVLSNTILSFDINGLLTEKKTLVNHRIVSQIKYNYDNNTTQTGYTDLNNDGSIYLKVKNEIDKNGFVKTSHFNRSEQRKYDINRKKIDVEFADYYDKLFTDIIYKRDYKGYVLEEKYLDINSKQLFKLTYKYDYKYQLVELKYYNSTGQAEKRIKYRYNSYGYTSECKTYQSNRLALTQSFNYTYDEHHNWINRFEKRQIENNIFTSEIDTNSIVTSRIIAYYN